MNQRDLLLEFIQWLVDHRPQARDIIDEEDPDAAIEAVDLFLESIAKHLGALYVSEHFGVA